MDHFMKNYLALTEFVSFTTEVTGKMVSASVEGEMLDYAEEELEEILKDVEIFEREELGESDIEGLMKTWKWIAIQKMSPCITSNNMAAGRPRHS